MCKLNEKHAGVEGVEIPRDDLLEVGYGDNLEEADAMMKISPNPE